MARSSGYKRGEEGTSIMVESIVESIVGLECVVDCILTLCGKENFEVLRCCLATQILVGLPY